MRGRSEHIAEVGGLFLGPDNAFPEGVRSLTLVWPGDPVDTAAETCAACLGAASTRRGDYVLVSAARNEASTLETTIRSVLNQSLLPREWIIVDNDSSDGTKAIVDAFAKQAGWIRYAYCPWRSGAGYANKVRALQLGADFASVRESEFLGVLDADVELPPHYYQCVLDALLRHPDWGIAGGIVTDTDASAETSVSEISNVSGAVQVFRRACWESIGGLVPIPEGGEDTIACVTARLCGFQTRVLPELVVRHLKARGASSGGQVRRMWMSGRRDAAMGVHPLYAWIKYLAALGPSPWIVRGVLMLGGYCARSWFGGDLLVPRAVIQHLRNEQLELLRRQLRWALRI